MKIDIIAVGKIKEKFYRDAIAEYSKRLSRYCTLEIIEIPDERHRIKLVRFRSIKSRRKKEKEF